MKYIYFFLVPFNCSFYIFTRCLALNSAVTKQVKACVRNATAKHECIVWLDRTAIFKVKSPCLSHRHCFLSSQMILACFAIALWVHLGPTPLLILLPVNWRLWLWGRPTRLRWDPNPNKEKTRLALTATQPWPPCTMHPQIIRHTNKVSGEKIHKQTNKWKKNKPKNSPNYLHHKEQFTLWQAQLQSTSLNGWPLDGMSLCHETYFISHDNDTVVHRIAYCA